MIILLKSGTFAIREYLSRKRPGKPKHSNHLWDALFVKTSIFLRFTCIQYLQMLCRGHAWKERIQLRRRGKCARGQEYSSTTLTRTKTLITTMERLYVPTVKKWSWDAHDALTGPRVSNALKGPTKFQTSRATLTNHSASTTSAGLARKALTMTKQISQSLAKVSFRFCSYTFCF